MQKTLTKNISIILLVFIVVSYLYLFKLSIFPAILLPLSQIISVSFLVISILIGIIYFPAKRVKMNFSTPVTLLIIAAIPGVFMARYFHQQNILLSVFAYRIILFYLLYYYLHIYKIPVKYIINIIVGIGLMAVALYYIQLFLFPKMIMNIHFIEGRGTIRLFVPGMIFTQATYFFFLHKFFNEKKILFLILSLLSLSIFILQGTRQLIFALIFLTMVYLLLSKRVKSKLMISFLFTLAIIAIFFIFQNIFYELTKVSSSQASGQSGGVRLRAMEYFITDFSPNKLTYIFGNGTPAMGSIYNQKMGYLAFKHGFFLSDIGILGDYIKYGIIFVLAGLALLYKSLRFKVNTKFTFLKYYILSQCFTLIAGSGIFSGVDIVILMILYVFDVDRDNRNHSKIKPNTSSSLRYTQANKAFHLK